MSELKGSIVRSKEMWMLSRNPGKTFKRKRVYNQLMKSVKISTKKNLINFNW